MLSNSMLQCFAYSKHYHKLQALEFLHDLFGNPEMQQSLQVHVLDYNPHNDTGILVNLVHCVQQLAADERKIVAKSLHAMVLS